MKAVALRRFGPPSVLQVREVAVPQPGPREILIAMHVAGVGSWDTAVRDGSWKPPGRPHFPIIPGTDGAGYVAAVGTRVRELRAGDRVFAYEFGNPKGGFYAEYAVAKVRHAARVPRKLSTLQAGVAAPTALTALQGIELALGRRRRAVLLIFGATGAVGTAAVQLAKRKGAYVIATATGPKAIRLVRRLGANATIDARARDIGDRLHSLAPKGLDAVLAFAGGDALEKCIDQVRARGRIVYPNGIEPEPRRRRTLQIRVYDLVADPRGFMRLRRILDRSRFAVPIAATLPLEQAARAHQRLEQGHVLGRMALRIR